MYNATTKKFSANEKEISGLLKENENWKRILSDCSLEITFLNRLLQADVYEEDTRGLQNDLQNFIIDLEELRREKLDLQTDLHNHRYDIEGMLECEDIGCEVFYHDEHLKLENRLNQFTAKFRELKLEVFSFSGDNLRKRQ